MVLLFMLTMLMTAAGPAFAREYDWQWFMYERESAGLQSTFVMRPFYLRHETEKRRFDASLMPLVFWRYKTGVKDDWRGLLGFFNSLEYRHEYGINDYDLGIFPFIYYGTSPEERDRYFMLWPFGGVLKGKLGQERIVTALFPGVLLFVFFPPASFFSLTTTLYAVVSLLPLYVSYSRADYAAWGLAWPIFTTGKSATRDDLRILPFYAHHRKKDTYKKYSILVLFNYEEQYYSHDTRYTFFFFPVYGRKWSDSGRISSHTVLWPFFSWGYDKKNKSTQYNLPWPLVQIEDTATPHIRKRIFFPFYGRYNYEKKETFFVTPLYFRLSKEGAVFNSNYYYHFIVVWYFKKDYHGSDPVHGKYWRYFKIWPLASVEYSEKGYRAVNFLSLLPMRDPEGYEKLYEPLWTLFEYRRFTDGEKRMGFLFRTYYQRWGGDYFQCKVPLLFSYSKAGGNTVHAGFMLSMFGFEQKKSGKYIRIFWVPVRVGEADPGLAVNPGMEDDLRSGDNEADHGKIASMTIPDFPGEKAGRDFYVAKTRF